MGQNGFIQDGFRAIAPKSGSLQSVQVVMGVTAGLGGLGLMLQLASRPPSTVIGARGFGYAAVAFVVGGLGLIYLALWRRNVRLLMGSGQVGYQDIFGRRRYWVRGQIDRAVDVAVIYTKSSTPQRGVYLLGPDGRRVLALSARAWDPDNLREFVEASGVLLDYRELPLTAAEARRQFPRAFGWGSQHVWLATTITVTLALVLVIGGFVLWSAVSRG